jgi:hypothetical protein
MNPMPIARRALLIFSLVAMVLCAWLAPLDLPAMKKVDEGLKRALISFASARALNAVISLAQGTEASVQPLGIGLTLTPGRILEPVHDLVEQFSTLMLAASVIFGLQKALILMGGYWPVSLTLAAVALGWAWFSWRGRPVPALLSSLLVVLLMLRFAVPLVTLGSDLLWQKFLASDYEASQHIMGSASGQAATLDPSGTPVVSAPPADTGLLDKLKAWGAQNADIKLNFESMKQALEKATEHVIRLIVIFLLQTLVIPLLLAWILYVVARRAFEWPAGRQIMQLQSVVQ